MPEYDAIVIGSGPNGLSAALELARNNLRVLVIEGRDSIGGGSRTAEVTLPGFRHDFCSAVFALGRASPFFRRLNLERYGLQWAQPEVPVAHALDDGAVALYRSIAETAEALGPDGRTYRRLLGPLVAAPDDLYDTVLGPIARIPPHPLMMIRFGLRGLPSARIVAARFKTERARGLFSGLAAHATSDFGVPLTSATALVLAAAAHTHGYPFARGGSQAVADALAAAIVELGGKIQTGTWVESLDEVPEASVYLLDVMPAAAARLASSRLSPGRRAKLGRWRHGPAVFKVDFATSDPVPWRDELLRRAGTVHLGGTFEEVDAAERAPWRGRHVDRPFLILAQPTVVDPSRAPEGKHTVWAYAHVPNGSDRDLTNAITAQIERFAPGFRDTILHNTSTSPAGFSAYNPNNVGGDIGGGRFSFGQVLARPRFSLNPYRIGESVYLCSAATPPGAGVHGMSGYHAARSALRALGRTGI